MRLSRIPFSDAVKLYLILAAIIDLVWTYVLLAGAIFLVDDLSMNLLGVAMLLTPNILLALGLFAVTKPTNNRRGTVIKLFYVSSFVR